MAASVISTVEKERGKSREQIIEEHYQRRGTVRELARDLGVSEAWARRILDDAGYATRVCIHPKSE